MRLQFIGGLTALAMQSACGATAPVEDIPAFVGSYCASATPTVTRDASGTTTVSMTRNTLTYRDVRRSDGVIVTQEVRGCVAKTCGFIGGAGQPDSYFVSLCQQQAG